MSLSLFIRKYYLVLVSLGIHVLMLFSITPLSEVGRDSPIKFNLIGSPKKEGHENSKAFDRSLSKIHKHKGSETHFIKNLDSRPKEVDLFGYKVMKSFKVETNDSNKEHFSDENILVDASRWANSLTPEQLISIKPFVQELSVRLAGGLHYIQELLDRRIMGVVEIEFSTNANGILLHMNMREGDVNNVLAGIVQAQLKEILSTPLTRVSPISENRFILKTNFQIIHIRNEMKSDDMIIDGNRIYIHVLSRQKSRYDVTEWDLDDNIFTRIFKRRKIDQREWYDFNLKTQALGRACEIEGVDEVCFKTAENYFIMGQLKESKRYLNLACIKGGMPQCQELELQIKKLHESD